MARRTKKNGTRGQSRQKGFFLRNGKGQQKMTTTTTGLTTQKSHGLYAMVGLLVVLLAFVAVTFYLITRDSRNEQEWIRLATDLQVQSQQLAKSSSDAVEGITNAFLELGDSRSAIEETMEALKQGDTLKSLPPLPELMSSSVNELGEIWNRMSENASSILDREDQVLKLAGTSADFINIIPEIQAETDNVVRDLTQNDATIDYTAADSQHQQGREDDLGKGDRSPCH